MEEVIDRTSNEFKELIRGLNNAVSAIDCISAQLKPTLCNERYLTGEDICRTLHISKRALQEYRDKRVLPYTSIGGKILYPETEIRALLERNHTEVLRE